MAGGECVAYEDGVGGWYVHGDAPRRVPRHADDHRASRQVEHIPVPDLDDLLKVSDAQSRLAQPISEEAECRPKPRWVYRSLRLLTSSHAMSVGCVDKDGHADFLPQAFREADVVAVTVSEDEPADVGERSAEDVQLAAQVVPVAGQTRVDEGDPLRQVDEIRGDDVVAQAMQAVAARVGVRAPSLYKRFRDRDALLTAVVGPSIDELTDRLETATPSLTRRAMAYREFARERPEAFRLIFTASAPQDALRRSADPFSGLLPCSSARSTRWRLPGCSLLGHRLLADGARRGLSPWRRR